jgi:hypothetical protein
MGKEKSSVKLCSARDCCVDCTQSPRRPLGSVVEHSLHTRGVNGSNPLAGTNYFSFVKLNLTPFRPAATTTKPRARQLSADPRHPGNSRGIHPPFGSYCSWILLQDRMAAATAVVGSSFV